MIPLSELRIEGVECPECEEKENMVAEHEGLHADDQLYVPIKCLTCGHQFHHGMGCGAMPRTPTGGTQLVDVGSIDKMVRVVLLAHVVELGDQQRREAWARGVLAADLEIGEYGALQHCDRVAKRVVQLLAGGDAAPPDPRREGFVRNVLSAVCPSDDDVVCVECDDSREILDDDGVTRCCPWCSKRYSPNE